MIQRTIAPRERDILWDNAQHDLHAELNIGLGRDEITETIGRVTDTIALFDDIGWDEHDSRMSYTLTMPDDQLSRILGRLEEAARELLHDDGPNGHYGGRPEYVDEDLELLHTALAIGGRS